MSILKQEADARDIVQDTMMKAWEEIGELRLINSVEAWCMTVTRNKALNLLNRKSNKFVELPDELNQSVGRPDPLRQTVINDSVNRIKVIMEMLPLKQREVIHLRDVEGYSYKEIAEVLDLSMNHVKVLLHRARHEIREQLMKAHNHGIKDAQ